MKIITIAQLKGGSGKTTTAAALAQAAKADGLKVLAIDLDPQANFSFCLAGDHTAPGAFAMLESGARPLEVIQETEQGIDLIAGSQALATVKTEAGSARRLYRALKDMSGRQYDLAVIDTPATLGELHYNALQTSDGLIVPMEADINNISGLYKICGIALQMQKVNQGLQILGAILTRFDGRSKINRSLKDVLESKAAGLKVPLLMAIRQGIAIKEAQSLQKSLFEYEPKSNPAIDYMTLYKMIKEREEL